VLVLGSSCVDRAHVDRGLLAHIGVVVREGRPCSGGSTGPALIRFDPVTYSHVSVFVCIFTIIICSKDQVFLCPIQFCSRLNSVESVPVQCTHQIFPNHSCPDSVSSINIIFSRTWFSRSYTWSPCTISLYRQVGCTVGFNSRRYNISKTTLRDFFFLI